MTIIHQYTTTVETNTDIIRIDNFVHFHETLRQEYTNLVWIIDEHLKKHNFLQELSQVVWVHAGESSKSWDALRVIYEDISNFGLDRKSCVVAIGGGTISDVAGFIASTYFRGIALILVPSTVLNIIDAAIGGKNGINFLGAKNQIGTIYQPRSIVLFYELLSSLPKKQFADGFAEIIKYGLIGDPVLFHELLENDLEHYISNMDALEQIFNRCIIQKSRIVEQDALEGGKRRILNFGHTIGHAIESRYGYSHGISVGLGMILAVKLSERIEGNNPNWSSKLLEVMRRYGLPTRCEEFDVEEIFSMVTRDKKSEGDTIHFVLLQDIGAAYAYRIPLHELKGWLIKCKEEKWIE